MWIYFFFFQKKLNFISIILILNSLSKSTFYHSVYFSNFIVLKPWQFNKFSISFSSISNDIYKMYFKSHLPSLSLLFLADLHPQGGQQKEPKNPCIMTTWQRKAQILQIFTILIHLCTRKILFYNLLCL